MEKGWLPVTKKEVDSLGWDQPDVIIFTGDAYIDHPSFGGAVIARVVEDEGLRVAVIPQPNWKDDLRDFRKLGRPGYFFGVTAGNMDSMVNHYTAARRLRSDDAYTPGGKSGFRPDYPTVVYTKILRDIFPDVPVIAGGIEASMRRLTHYDYWQDRLLPSIITSSGADMIIYGMAEKPLREIIRLIKSGVPFSSITTLPQTVITAGKDELPSQNGWKDIFLHSYEECLKDKKKFSENFVAFERESNKIRAGRLIEPSGERLVIVNPPCDPPEEEDTDRTFDLPYKYMPHPKYRNKGLIPAYEMIKFSVNTHRGCFGGCSFCAISAHQGKQIISRSEDSIINEIKRIKNLPDFKGYISDMGGPSANMYKMKGRDLMHCRACSRPSCIWPDVCRNLDTNHKVLTELYRKVNSLPGIKKAFVSSGVRYDLLFREWNRHAGREEMEYLRELIANHVSGRLKVAPEHTSPKVLKLIRKPPFSIFRIFKQYFDKVVESSGMKYQIVPYFISSLPGSSDKEMSELADELKELGLRPEQVQDFTPTPMTLSTLIYYTGINPYNGERVYVARKPEDKKHQKEYFFRYRKHNFAPGKKGKPGKRQSLRR